MKKFVLLAAVCFVFSGCAATQATFDFLGSVFPDPQPVCEQGTVGANWQGKECLKFSDGTYRWEVK